MRNIALKLMYNGTASVSYTHLLRELVLRLADVVLPLVLHKQHQPQRCLLYTSRCV